MLHDPKRFIRQKLSKKFLSPNTVRDGLIAALLIALEQRETAHGGLADPESWRRAKAGEIRGEMRARLSAVGAPFEYPSAAQLTQAAAGLAEVYRLGNPPEPLRCAFDADCNALLAKLENKL